MVCQNESILKEKKKKLSGKILKATIRKEKKDDVKQN